jgi:hypothetical protein
MTLVQTSNLVRPDIMAFRCGSMVEDRYAQCPAGTRCRQSVPEAAYDTGDVSRLVNFASS